MAKKIASMPDTATAIRFAAFGFSIHPTRTAGGRARIEEITDSHESRAKSELRTPVTTITLFSASENWMALRRIEGRGGGFMGKNCPSTWQSRKSGPDPAGRS